MFILTRLSQLKCLMLWRQSPMMGLDTLRVARQICELEALAADPRAFGLWP